MGTVRGRSRHPRRNRPGFGDALLQQLTIAGFAVIEHGTRVFRLVQLAQRRVNADLAKQIGHAKGARFIRHNRHDSRPQFFVLEQTAQHADHGHGGGHFLAIGFKGETRVVRHGRYGDVLTALVTRRQITAQCTAAFAQIAHFLAVFSRAIKA